MKDQNSLEGKMYAAITKEIVPYVDSRRVAVVNTSDYLDAANACAQIAIDHAALSTHPTKQLYEAVPVEKELPREERRYWVLNRIGDKVYNGSEWFDPSAQMFLTNPQPTHWLRPYNATQVQEGEVERLREALRKTLAHVGRASNAGQIITEALGTHHNH